MNETTRNSISSLERFRLARNILLAGFGINLIYVLICGFVFDLGYTYSTFLFRPPDRFQDFYAVMPSTWQLDPYQAREVVNVSGHFGVEMSNYFPFTHLLFYPFTWISQESALVVFLILTAIFMFVAFWKVMSAVGEKGTPLRLLAWAAFLPLNYPVLMAFDRGNIEL